MKYALSTLIAVFALNGAIHAQAPAGPGKAPSGPVKAPTGPIKAPRGPLAPEDVQNDDREPTADEELALAALEGLMAQPGDRALPIIKKVLAGSQTTLVKQRALFVLSQIDSAEARQILAQTSKSSNAALRREAIRSIGIGGDPTLLASLQETYAAGDQQVKQEVLQAWLIAGRKESIYQVALNAKSEDEATQAIHMLGAMGATEELRKLADRPNASSGLIDAFAVSGDLGSLRKIAESNTNREVRIDAVRKMGIVGSDEARKALRDAYVRGNDPEMKEAALQGMLISGDEEGVLTLYRAAKSNEEKRTLLRTLSLIDGDAALKAIDEALGEKK